MSLLIGLSWILFTTTSYSLCFNKKFEICLPFSMMVSAMIMFLCGLFNNIFIGYILTYIIPALILISLFVNKRINQKVFKENIITIGMIFSVIIFIYVSFLQRNRMPSHQDELFFWSTRVYEYIETNSFTKTTHPPFISLIETLFCYFNKGIYNESALFRGVTFFCLSLGMPLLSSLKIEKVEDIFKGTIIALVFVLLGCTTITNYFDRFSLYDLILPDYPLGIMLAYTIFISFKKEEYEFFDYINFLLAAISLMLTKRIAIVLILLSFLSPLSKFCLDKLPFKLIAKRMIIIIAIPMMVYSSWTIKTNSDVLGFMTKSVAKEVYNTSETNEEVNNAVSHNEIITIDDKIIEKQDKDTINVLDETSSKSRLINYYLTILKFAIITKPVKMSYFVYAVVIAAGLLITNKKSYRGLALAAIYLFGAVGYTVALAPVFAITFKNMALPVLTSFDRYLGSYMVAGTYLLIMTVINEIKGKNISYYLLPVFITSILVHPSELSKLKPIKYEENIYYEYEQYISEIFCLDNDAKILIVDQIGSTSEGFEWYYCNFHGLNYERIKNIEKHSFGLTKYNLSGSKVNIEKEEFLDYCKNFDYVYLHNVDIQFDDFFKLASIDPMYNHTMYKFNDNGLLQIMWMVGQN